MCKEPIGSYELYFVLEVKESPFIFVLPFDNLRYQSVSLLSALLNADKSKCTTESAGFKLAVTVQIFMQPIYVIGVQIPILQNTKFKYLFP